MSHRVAELNGSLPTSSIPCELNAETNMESPAGNGVPIGRSVVPSNSATFAENVARSAEDYTANMSTQSGVERLPGWGQAELLWRIERRIRARGNTLGRRKLGRYPARRARRRRLRRRVAPRAVGVLGAGVRRARVRPQACPASASPSARSTPSSRTCAVAEPTRSVS